MMMSPYMPYSGHRFPGLGGRVFKKLLCSLRGSVRVVFLNCEKTLSSGFQVFLLLLSSTCRRLSGDFPVTSRELFSLVTSRRVFPVAIVVGSWHPVLIGCLIFGVCLAILSLVGSGLLASSFLLGHLVATPELYVNL